MKAVWYWHKDRQEDQWNCIKDMDINPHTFKYLVFDKEAKNIKWKKESILTHGAGITENQYIEGCK